MKDMVVWGLGELGQLFGAAALRAGYRVTPITRTSEPNEIWASVPAEAPLWIAVGERDLDTVLQAVPEARRDAVVLVQNGLFPEHWQGHGIDHPTVLTFWSNKKAGKPLMPGFRSGVWGPNAELVATLHEIMGVSCEVLESEARLVDEIVSKFSFILSINALGLVDNIPVGRWLERDETPGVVDDAIALGEACVGQPCDRERVKAQVEGAMRALASMSARGRSAPQRMAKAKLDGARLGVALPHLEALPVVL